MPSVTPFQPPPLSASKKRRRDDDDGDVQVPLYGSPKLSTWSRSTNNSDVGSRTSTPYDENLLAAIHNNERLIFPSSLNMPPKVIPLPVSKRFRLFSENEGHLHSHPSQQSHLSHAHPEYSTPPASPQHPRTNTAKLSNSNPSALLNPCHICHRKPTKKSDLDSFADCAGCGQRACFVCIRACQGWLSPSSDSQKENLAPSFTMQDIDDCTHDQGQSEKHRKGGGPDEGWTGRGHREMICSRCCVERGSEGDVVCLGCLGGMEGA
ncbi:hypothetical protein F4819DRAFT_85967 [Hypoxylon fuscum]|nr:hypothetical protein F4819DRAFT_85967 [Hypoxylon fuscum]